MQIKRFKQKTIKHTSIVNVIRFATERPRKNCSKQKLRKQMIINSSECGRRCSQRFAIGGGGGIWGSGAEPPALENSAFFFQK